MTAWLGPTRPAARREVNGVVLKGAVAPKPQSGRSRSDETISSSEETRMRQRTGRVVLGRKNDPMLEKGRFPAALFFWNPYD